MKNIFWYLRRIENMNLTFSSNHPTEIEGFTNSDYANNLYNQKSTWSNFVTKLKECTTFSTAEAKYIVMSEAEKEAIWLQRLFSDFSAKSRIVQNTLTLYCDAHSAIHLIQNPIYHSKKKHLKPERAKSPKDDWRAKRDDSRSQDQKDQKDERGTKSNLVNQAEGRMTEVPIPLDSTTPDWGISLLACKF